jgi:hypothetical protein
MFVYNCGTQVRLPGGNLEVLFSDTVWRLPPLTPSISCLRLTLVAAAQVCLPGGNLEVLFSDTVGFIQKLPLLFVRLPRAAANWCCHKTCGGRSRFLLLFIASLRLTLLACNQVRLPGGNLEVLFSDTVGFIQKLPTQLVAAFRATLEEIASASVVLHVLDVSADNAPAQCAAVLQVRTDSGS